MQGRNTTRVRQVTRGGGRRPAQSAANPANAASPVLVKWSQVFPLSAGPEQRIRRHAGGDIPPADLAAATARYVDKINDRLPEHFAFDVDGSVRGPAEHSDAAAQALFGAAFDTDLDAVLRQVRRR